MVMALVICFSSCVGNSYNEHPKTPEQLRTELKQQESNTPLMYLTDQNVTLLPQQKKIRDAVFFRDAEYAPDGAIINGDFINKATLAKFKDITVDILFYSQTQTVINEKSFVIYQYSEPNSTSHFALKIDTLPQAYKNFSCTITGATPVYE